MNIISTGGQGSELWFQERIGTLSSSRIARAVKKAKRESTGELQTRKDLKLELAVERVTNKPSDYFVSEWMKRGTELEPLARAAFELRMECEVELIDLVLHDSIYWAACSPDGKFNNELIEIKCPSPSTHAEYLLGEIIPTEYVPQLTWQLACCKECVANTFVSFCPIFPEPLNLFICRMERDEKKIAEIEVEGIAFLEEVKMLQERLRGA